MTDNLPPPTQRDDEPEGITPSMWFYSDKEMPRAAWQVILTDMFNKGTVTPENKLLQQHFERLSQAQADRRAGGSKYMRGDAKEDFLTALKKHAVECYKADTKPEARGWKKIVANQLGTRWKDIVPWLTPERWNMTETDCINIMHEQDPSR